MDKQPLETGELTCRLMKYKFLVLKKRFLRKGPPETQRKIFVKNTFANEKCVWDREFHAKENI